MARAALNAAVSSAARPRPLDKTPETTVRVKVLEDVLERAPGTTVRGKVLENASERVLAAVVEGTSGVGTALGAR
ncbi:hypothetical protein Abr02nite_15080 [Paractinoplanes brasiliensis]|nr:hypothetical protein Abr02nite_15080 [Actinoplanes brasiliensis]